MQILDIIMWPLRALGAEIAAHRRLGEFSCSDCECYNSCGLPPSEQCTRRQSYIARYGNRPQRRIDNTAMF
ncbi:MAG: hypothetical protein GC182_19710 [Rhodopseudomonas sp.]|nr:hypothetical protein [Rhodopseudomonas sp.]